MNYPPKKIRSIEGQVVVFTGSLPGMTQAEAKELVYKAGGETNDKVTRKTTLLVRGESSVWMFREFGNKEDRVARYISLGDEICVIEASCFIRLAAQQRPVSPSKFVAGVPLSELVLRHDQAKSESGLSIPTGALDRWTQVKSRRCLLYTSPSPRDRG